MDYSQFKQYRSSLPASILSLDDLNPYELLGKLDLNDSACKQEIAYKGLHIKKADGVRELLKGLFSQFSQTGHSIVLPADIYPVYFDLVPDDILVTQYETYNIDRIEFPDIPKAVMLMTDPIVPEGRYFSKRNWDEAEKWLNEDNGRWLLVDNVYDLKLDSIKSRTLFENTIYLNSLTKTKLTPGKLGWATSRTELPGFNRVTKPEIVSCYSQPLKKIYQKAWADLELLEIIPKNLWKTPEVGYLTTVKEDYKSLLLRNISAIPASVYGIRRENISVISCLSLVKDYFE